MKTSDTEEQSKVTLNNRIIKLPHTENNIAKTGFLTIFRSFNRDSESLEHLFHHFFLWREIHFQKKFSEANLLFIPPNIIIS